MGSYSDGGGDPSLSAGSPVAIFYPPTPVDCTIEDLLWPDESAAGHILPDPQPPLPLGPEISDDLMKTEDTDEDQVLLDEPAGDPQSAGGDASWRQAVLHPVGLAGSTAAATGVVENPCETDGPLSVTGAGMEDIPYLGSAPLGFNMGEINAAFTSTVAVKGMGILSDPREPSRLVVVNAGLVVTPEPSSAGDSSCVRATTADMGIISSPDLEVNAGACLPQSLTETLVRLRESSKRKTLDYGYGYGYGWSRQWLRPPPEFSFGFLIPGAGSTDTEIIDFLGRFRSNNPSRGKEINLSLGEEDQNGPTAVRRYITTAQMKPHRRSNQGYWKELHVKTVRGPLFSLFRRGTTGSGLKRTFRFHKFNGSRTNLYMDEYIPTNRWGIDWYMEDVRFREVYEGEAVLGEPPEEKIKNKIAAAKKHRMRGPKDLVIKKESPAWHHFIKVYDRHPELEGSKVVYAVCCHCDEVLKAGTENGTKSLLTHCNRTCPVKNKKQQPSSSSSNSSTGDTTSCLSTAADTGSSSPDQDFNAGAGAGAGAGLPQSGGGCTLAEAPVQASCKRQKLICGSSSQRSAPPDEWELLLADFLESDPSSTDIKPPTGSTNIEIIRFLEVKGEESLMPPHGKDVNLRLGEQDQMSPVAVQSYITTVKPDQNLHDLGYWKEKQVKLLREDESDGIGSSWCRGLKRTFQFHMDDGSETNWFMHEYVPMDSWGYDLFMKPLRFREVYEEVVPEVKTKNKNAAGKKHRMRRPENMVIKGESEAWQHFIKVYDSHPELEGSKLVYALCCHCEGVLKAGTENGTSSLLEHCKNNCPAIKNKQQPCSSSYQENHSGVSVGVGVL